MSQRLFHRGPDDGGVFIDPGAQLTLAMRRLSIVDLAGGAQPMHSPDGRYTIVYNGEIFNARELRQNMEAAGERFATDHSDTEVLLRLLMREGESCLDRLNGMFAFALWDRLEHTLSLVKGAGKTLEEILSSVKRLPAGHCLKYSLADRKLEIKRWWQVTYEPDRSVSATEWPALIHEELRRAVVRWSQADVPIAVSLSGGLDSSAIATIAVQAGLDISAYSLGFEGEGEAVWNELPLARDVARKWNIPHHELVLRPEATLDALPRMVEALDEPYGGGLPSWFVFEQMAGKVKVAHTGTGGDELFGNYGKWRPLEGGLMRRLLGGATATVDRARFAREFFDRHYYFPDDDKRNILADGGASCRDTADLMYERLSESGQATLRDGIAALDIGTQLPDEFLFMTDRFSMAHSIEARTPFLDSGLVDLVRRIPAEIRTHRGDLKYLLRQAVAPLLPESVLSAPKRGFVIPFGLWLRGPLRSTVEELLAPDRLREQGLFSPRFYDAYVKPHIDGRAEHTQRIWSAMMFQLWHRRFMEGAQLTPAAGGIGALARA